MDHSIQGYLSRRSTEELKAILKHFSEEENCRNYEHTVLEIRDALAQRLESEADNFSYFEHFEKAGADIS